MKVHRILTILSCIILMIAFFLPWVNIMGIEKLSARELISADIPNAGFVYILYLIPVTALTILVLKVSGSKDVRGLYFLPFISVAIVFLWAYIKIVSTNTSIVDDNDILGTGVSIRRIFNDMLSYGFWITALFSFILFILGFSRPPTITNRKKRS